MNDEVLLGAIHEIGEPLRDLLQIATRLGHRVVIALNGHGGVTLTALPKEEK